MITPDLEKAFNAIRSKRQDLTNYYNYVNGPQPLKYSTERLEHAFEDIRIHFEINWCSVIVDATNDRLALSGFDIKDAPANKWMSEQFEQLQIALEGQKVHKAALGYTQGFLIIWKNDEGEVEIYYNDPRLCEVFYDPESPKKKVFAAKWFVTQDVKIQEITLYYPDKLEHWQAKVKSDNQVEKATQFVLETEEPNPYGTIPVFEFYCEGEIQKVTYLQDAVNKTFADMMVAGEFGAFVQRWVIAQTDPGDLKNEPNSIWWIPAADQNGQGSQVGQFTPSVLSQYLDSMDRLASAMFIITRTPKHYLINAGANISGEALIAMEAPFIAKVGWYKKRFDPFWKDVAQFILLLNNMAVDTSNILPLWARSEATQPLTEAQTMQTMVNTGLPLITVLRRSGWSEAEIKALEADMKKEKADRQSIAQAVLDSLRNQSAQENPKSDGQQPGNTPNPPIKETTE